MRDEYAADLTKIAQNNRGQSQHPHDAIRRKRTKAENRQMRLKSVCTQYINGEQSIDAFLLTSAKSSGRELSKDLRKWEKHNGLQTEEQSVNQERMCKYNLK